MNTITKGGIILRVVLAVLFFTAVAGGFLMAFFPFETKPDQKELTDNITDAVTETKKVFVIVTGDMMLDRNVLSLTRRAGDYGYPFEMISGYLSRADLRVGNLEGPITSNPSVSISTNGMRFTFPTEFLPELAKMFDVLLIGNNHALDFGEEGAGQTRNNLTNGGIAFFGDYLNRGESNSTVVKKNGIKIGFVGYHALPGKNLDNSLIDTAKLRQVCDFVIVMPHWGEEYDVLENEAQREAAERFIDAGADAVIGGHPHVVQPISSYKGKPIFWSIGNFIFDQYFSEETMRAISPTIEIAKLADGSVSAKYGIVPIAIGKDSRPRTMEGKEAEDFLAEIAGRSDVSDESKKEIRSGSFDPAK